MKDLTTIGIDTAKNYIQVHGEDDRGKKVLTKRLSRANFLPYMVNLPKCLIGMEACGGSNYWARELTKLGFEVNCDWNDIAGLKTSGEFKRCWSVQEKYFFKEKIDELFDEKYGQSFNEVSEIIDDISTKYEEAINFGDLELVKKLYYIMKSSEQLFKKIDKLVI